MKKLGIIHTTPVTIETLKKLAADIMPDCEIINIMDDTILPELNQNGGDIEAVRPRWESYAKSMEASGADAVLSACSSVGDLTVIIQPNMKVPVLRIDEAMADYAIKNASRIGVAATLPTTLKPTMNLLKQKAAKAGKQVEFVKQVATGAYQKLMAGDSEGHDEELSEVLGQLARETEVVILAQASMARVVQTLPEKEQGRFLTSPQLGMECVKERLYQSYRGE